MASTPDIEDETFECTGFKRALSVIGGKYKTPILYALGAYGTVRFNQLQRYLSGISFRTLSANLKQLEADGLVRRVEYPQVPPKVEYSLTDKGRSLAPIIGELCAWGEEHES